MSETIGSSSVICNIFDKSLIEDEFVNFLRNNLTDRRDRAEYATENFTSDGSSLYELTGDLDSKGRHKIMCVKELTVDGVKKDFIKDYIVGFKNDSSILGKIYFWNAPASGSIINIQYYWRYSMVFSEEPRTTYTSERYPIVTFQISDFTPEDASIGAKVKRLNIEFTISIIDLKKTDVETVSHQIFRLFTDEPTQHSFHSVKYVRDPKFTPVVPFGEDTNDVVFLQQVVLECPRQYQIGR